MPRGDRRECPCCGGFDTKHGHWEYEATEVQEVRQCRNCPVQYTNTFSNMDYQIDRPEAFKEEPPDDDDDDESEFQSGNEFHRVGGDR